MKPIDNNDSEELRLNLLTQEIKFAKMLAGNTFDGALKEKHIDKLSFWLKSRASCTEEFTDKDCLRIWKGLFYSMWMSDKPLPQENLATKIANLMHSFDRIEASFQFFGAFLKTMANEWNGIDQWRIDKFMMLVRRVTREMIRIIQQNDWNDDAIEKLDGTLKKTVLGNDHVPRGLFMHFTELFFEEVAKVSNGEIEPEHVTKLLQPFMFYVASQGDYKLIQFVVRHVFNHLLFQSECGREYKEKFDVWKSMNFPGNSIDELVREEPPDDDDDADENSESEEDEENTMNGENGLDDENESGEDETNDTPKTNQALDPRAGRVDVVMPELKFDPLEIVNKLEDLKYQKFTRVRNRRCIDRIVTTYKKFATGVFPIGIQKIKVDRDEIELPDIEEKAAELLEFENELYGEQRELKKMNKRKRKKIVSDAQLFEEFQAKSNKVAKIKLEANSWTEEDNTELNLVEEPPKKKKKSKSSDSNQTNELVNETPKPSKKHKVSEWEKPLEKGEVEYLIPSKKKRLNGVPIVTTTTESVTTTTPLVADKVKTNGIETTNENKSPSKKLKTPIKTPMKTPNVTPVISSAAKKANATPKSPKSPEKKVKSTSKLELSKTSTPNIFLDKATPSSAEKRVKIALKMNRSQEVTDYIRQLKQSPYLPYDSAKKPSKGVLKPNLAPSPINPFYKRLIGIE